LVEFPKQPLNESLAAVEEIFAHQGAYLNMADAMTSRVTTAILLLVALLCLLCRLVGWMRRAAQRAAQNARKAARIHRARQLLADGGFPRKEARATAEVSICTPLDDDVIQSQQQQELLRTSTEGADEDNDCEEGNGETTRVKGEHNKVEYGCGCACGDEEQAG
jgi:membrane-bound lytic murein transglycosylase B